MKVILEKATANNAKEIFDIQIEAFMPLLDKYKDYETNPANENIEKVVSRINRPDGGFYKIVADNKIVGAICIFTNEETKFWITQCLFYLLIKEKELHRRQYN